MTENSTELVRYESKTQSSLALVPEAMGLAETLARTNFVPAAFRGKPAEIVAALLQGHELDLPPMTALQTIHVIDGRPSLSAEVMRALVVQHGHEIWVEDVTDTRVTVAGRRREWPVDRVSRVAWTLDDAKRARLDQKENWRKYPRAMMTARATSELCRNVFPDVLRGLSYAIEEYRDGSVPTEEDYADVEVGAAPADAPPPPKPTRTRKAPAGKAPTGRPTPKPSAPAATSSPAALPPLPGEPESTTDSDVEGGEPAAQIAGDDSAAPDTAPTPPEPTTGEAGGASEDVEGGDPPRQSTEVRRAQMLAIRCREVLGEENVDELRHRLIGCATGGRVFSAREVTSEETEEALRLLQAIADGVAELVEGDDGEWLVVAVEDGDVVDAEIVEAIPNPLAPRESDRTPLIPLQPDFEDEWRSSFRKSSIRIPEAIREAARIADDLGLDTPTTLAEVLASVEIRTALWEWACDVAGNR